MREHKVLGPTVDGLSELAVSSFEQIEKLIEEGNRWDIVTYLFVLSEERNAQFSESSSSSKQ